MFDVKKHLIKVQGGRMYLPVSARLVWFRQEHPDWGIETRVVALDLEKQYAVFEAFVYNETGKLMAKGTKMEDVRGFPDYMEKAETGAIGRALAVCGFGTQFAPDLDEITAGRVVDSPQLLGRVSDAANGSGRISRPLNGSYSRPYGNGTREEAQVHQAEPAQPAGTESAAEYPVRENGTHDRSDEAVRATNPAPAADAAHASEHECSSCGRMLKQAQELLSVRKYGVALCPVCQKERTGAPVG